MWKASFVASVVGIGLGVGFSNLLFGDDEFSDYPKGPRVSVYSGQINRINSDRAYGKCKVLIDWKGDYRHHGKTDGHHVKSALWIEKSGADDKAETIWAQGILFGAAPDRTNAILNDYSEGTVVPAREKDGELNYREVKVNAPIIKELRLFFKDRDSLNEEERLQAANMAKTKRPVLVPEYVTLDIIHRKDKKQNRVLVCTIDNVEAY